MTRRGEILSAAVILQVITAHLQMATPAQAKEWAEKPIELREGRALKTSSILKKMYENQTAIVRSEQPILLGAYRVVTSGAA